MEKYIRAEMEVVAFEVEDVITTSNVIVPGGGSPNINDPTGCPNHSDLYQPDCPKELPMD